jgi:hypothetical protein
MALFSVNVNRVAGEGWTDDGRRLVTLCLGLGLPGVPFNFCLCHTKREWLLSVSDTRKGKRLSFIADETGFKGI